jgi:hypothetical protein
LVGASHVNFLDVSRIQAGPVDQGLDGYCSQIIGSNRGECAAVPAYRCAHCIDYDDVFHECSFLCSLTVMISSSPECRLSGCASD